MPSPIKTTTGNLRTPTKTLKKLHEGLKEVLQESPHCIIGFMDQTSPQLTANTQRLWSFTKPKVKKNTTKIKANAFGFYTINGENVLDFKENSKKECVCEFLEKIRLKNPSKPIILILDNFKSHWAKATREKAQELNIHLVFLPPYSPDLNPIEYIWKSIKKEISPKLIKTLNELKDIISKNFYKFSQKISFARRWIEKILVSLVN